MRGAYQRLPVGLQGGVASRPTVRFRPAPLRRIRRELVAFGAVFSSNIPRITVPRDKPLARDTLVTRRSRLPWPPAAAANRRVRSSRTPQPVNVLFIL
jgi:hypothetical protein